MNLAINPLIAIGVVASTAATDAAYVFFNAALGRELERDLVHAVGLRDDQLHGQRCLRRICGARIVARRFCFGDLAASRGQPCPTAA